jgi:hypothetical protein
MRSIRNGPSSSWSSWKAEVTRGPFPCDHKQPPGPLFSIHRLLYTNKRFFCQQQHKTAQRSTAQHSTAPHNTTQHLSSKPETALWKMEPMLPSTGCHNVHAGRSCSCSLSRSRSLTHARSDCCTPLHSSSLHPRQGCRNSSEKGSRYGVAREGAVVFSSSLLLALSSAP